MTLPNIENTKGCLIGISGKIGSGKSTAAKYIIEQMPGMAYEEKFFAYNVKLITSVISGLTMDDMLSQDGKNKKLPMYNNITAGMLQQIIGTDLFREHFDEMVWIKSLFAPYDKSLHNWIVSDVRFKNEAEYVKKMGGFLVRMEGDPMGVREASTRDLDHPSETDLDDYDGFDVIVYTEPGTDKLKQLVLYLERVLVYKTEYAGKTPYII